MVTAKNTRPIEEGLVGRVLDALKAVRTRPNITNKRLSIQDGDG